MTDTPLSEEEFPDARAIRNTLEGFVGELSDALPRSTIKKLVFGTVSLSEPDLAFDYKSEEFTREFLVDELLDAVGLQYRPQPKAHGIERWPDFELSNTVIPVVGEIKPLNDISAGEDQIRTYLSLDDFDTPYGILTDGVEWRVYGPGRSGSGYAIREQIRLDNALQTIAEQTEVIDGMGLSSTVREEGVGQITDFVHTFERNQFNDWSLIALPKSERERYIPDDYEAQSSFEDYQ